MQSTILTPDLYKQELRKNIEPLTKEAGLLTLPQFFSLMYYTLEIEKPGLIFAPAYPQYLMPDTPEHQRTMDNPTDKFTDTVTYMVTRQEPASARHPFSGESRELVPRIREVVNGDEQSTTIFGQRFDTLVQFDMWALSSVEVETLTIWFQRFMTVRRDFFKHMGLSEILFWWRGQDKVSAALRNNLHLRTLVYYIRVEEQSYEPDYNLNKLVVAIEEHMQ